MRYSIIKSHRSGYLIDDGSGSSIRYATKRLAEATVEAWVRRDKEEAEFAAEEKIARVARVYAYIARRAERREIDARQFNFGF